MKATVYVVEILNNDDELIDVWGVYSTKDNAKASIASRPLVKGEHLDIHEMIMDT
jgi:hypothetical protein